MILKIRIRIRIKDQDLEQGGGKRVIKENVELTRVACRRTTTRVLNPFDKLCYFHHRRAFFFIVLILINIARIASFTLICQVTKIVTDHKSFDKLCYFHHTRTFFLIVLILMKIIIIVSYLWGYNLQLATDEKGGGWYKAPKNDSEHRSVGARKASELPHTPLYCEH